MKLSILIRTIPERVEQFNKLLDEFIKQRQDLGMENEIQILYDDTPKGIINTGEKANILKSKAKGYRIVFFDDDDFPAPNYLMLIMRHCDSAADIITFNMNYFVNGIYKRYIVINLFGGESYNEKVQTIDRIYFHLCAVKRELSMQVDFPCLNFMEDAEYSERLKPLLKSAVHISENIYNYYFSEKDTETRPKK